jgi:hypothetical protein
METIVIRELNDLLENLVNEVDLIDSNNEVLFDRDFINGMFSEIDGYDFNTVLGRFIEKYDVEELEDNLLFKIADEIVVLGEKKTIKISAVSILKAKSFHFENWMLNYWFDRDLPNQNAELVFTDEAKEAIKHLLNPRVYKFADYTGDPVKDLKEALSLFVDYDDE